MQRIRLINLSVGVSVSLLAVCQQKFSSTLQELICELERRTKERLKKVVEHKTNKCLLESSEVREDIGYKKMLCSPSIW